MKNIFLTFAIFCLICISFNSAFAQNSQGDNQTETQENSDMKKSTKSKNTEVEATQTSETKEETQNVANNSELENIIVLELKDGPVVIELKPEVAPNHVERIKQLTRQGFYDNIVFHRVIDGFMAQTGDPTGTGRGGSGQNLNSEFSDEKHIRGTLSMARAADPNSADSQFFIMFSDAPHLDGNYSVFGQVISGMDFVDKIKRGTGANGMVASPDKIVRMRVATDIPEAELPASLKAEATEGVVSDGENTSENNSATEATTNEATPATEQKTPASLKPFNAKKK